MYTRNAALANTLPFTNDLQGEYNSQPCNHHSKCKPQILSPQVLPPFSCFNTPYYDATQMNT
jgi:hypothetical protein